MSLNEFIHMGGHGIYVWSSYFMTLAVIATAIQSARIKRKKLILDLQEQQLQAQQQKEK